MTCCVRKKIEEDDGLQDAAYIASPYLAKSSTVLSRKH